MVHGRANLSVGQTEQSLTCPIMEKPHTTGLDDCRTLEKECLPQMLSEIHSLEKNTYSSSARIFRPHSLCNELRRGVLAEIIPHSLSMPALTAAQRLTGEEESILYNHEMQIFQIFASKGETRNCEI